MLYSQLGYYVTGKISQWMLQAAAKEKMFSEAPDSVFESISLTAHESDIKWEEAGKEFTFHGQLYDIVRIKKISGQTVLICSSDEKEDELLHQMNDITKSNHQHNGTNSRLPDSKLLYDVVISRPVVQNLYYIRPAFFYVNYTVALPGQFDAIVLPPPRA